MFLFSCNTFINLGDSEKNIASGDSLPEELSDENKKGHDAGDIGDSGNTGGARGDGYPEYGDAENGNGSGSQGDSGNSGEGTDNGDSGNSGEKSDDEGSPSIHSYPFDENFTNEMCGCDEKPKYDPVCCTGNISVYNICFANCYGVHSSGKICSSYTPGVCDSVSDTVIENDSDFELDEDFFETPDEIYDNDLEEKEDDSIDDSEFDDEGPFTPADNMCGCYPEETSFNCCYVNGTVLIGKCMAECHCKGGYTNCF